jgi:hypothetical protein
MLRGCRRHLIGGKIVGIICGNFPEVKPCNCGKPMQFLCDWKIGKHANGRRKTCNAPICSEHALEVGPNKHLCPEHQKAWREWQAAHPSLL